MCNAILNSVGDQTDAQEEASPYGLTSVNLTPLLSHELSKRKNRWAATVKSIRDHKWRHYNEEISGDLTRSVENSGKYARRNRCLERLINEICMFQNCKARPPNPITVKTMTRQSTLVQIVLGNHIKHRYI